MDGELRDPRGAPKGHVKPIAATLSIAILLAVIATPPGTAQSQLPVKAAVFTIRDLGTGADTDFDELLSESIRLEIENAGYAVVDEWVRLLEPGEVSPVHGPRAAELARGAGAAVAVTGFYTRPDAGSVALSVQCWETDGETLLASFTLAAPFDLGYYNLLHDRLADFLAAAEKFTGPPRIEAIEVAEARGLGTITFLSTQDGVEVLLAGEKSLGSVAGGRLEAAVGLLTTGSRLELTLRKDGFHALATAVTAIPEVRLPELLPARRYSLELGWNNGQPIGVSAAINWFPVADWVFVGAATQVSAQFPTPAATGEYAVLHFEVGARVGVYLVPLKPSITVFGAKLDLPFRAGVVTGFGGMPSVSLSAGHPFWMDWYLMVPEPFIEIELGKTILTFRIDQRYSLGLPGSALDRGWIMRRVPNQSGDDTRDAVPVVLGVTFKW
ncbi:MAG TPA: hypothetical protein VLH81_00500 [Desulfobacterales bacterium]|nr:hypothetical protein [Desulfobacterales bacterium]